MLKISELKKGDVVWECEAGTNMRLTIQSEPQHVTELHGWPAVGWHVEAFDDHGTSIDLFVSDQSTAYGPYLYPMPMYASQVETNG